MRWVAGILLVCAALLKAVELVTAPAVTLVNPLGRYFLPLEIGIELAIGLLLLSGLYWRNVRWFAVLLFTGFAGYSLYLALNGAASCGCFGSVHIHPWWTFALDVVVVLGLLISALRACGQQSKEPESNAVRLNANRPYRRYLVAAAMGIAVIGTVLLVRYVDQRTAAAEGLVPAAGKLVILEPEQWVGKKLPITDSIDVDLSQGSWVILLHRHDCSVCQEVVPQYEQRAGDGERIALVEVPPYGDFERRTSGCQYGRLKEDREWFVQTPVEIRLRDGVVTAVNIHEH